MSVDDEQSVADRLREAEATIEHLRREQTTLAARVARQAAWIEQQAARIASFDERLQALYASRAWRWLQRAWSARQAATRLATALRHPGWPTFQHGHHGADLSVIIPAADHGPHLRECIESVLAQQPPPREILLVESDPADTVTRPVLEWATRNGAVTVLRNPDGYSPARALNRALLAAKGTRIALVAGDTVLAPGALAAFAAASAAESDAAVLSSGRTDVDAEGRELPRDRGDDPANGEAPAVVVFQRETLARVGLCSPDLSLGHRDDLVLRLIERAGVRHLAEALYRERAPSDAGVEDGGARRYEQAHRVWQRARRRRYLAGVVPDPAVGPAPSTLAVLVPDTTDPLLRAVVDAAVRTRDVLVVTRGAASGELAGLPRVTVTSATRGDEIATLLEAHHPGIVHVWACADGYAVAATLARRYPRPWVIDLVPDDRDDLIALSAGHRQELDHRLAASRVVARALVARTGEHPDRITVVPHAPSADGTTAVATIQAAYDRAADRGLTDGRRGLVSIVILSWNRPDALARCLAAIRRETRLPYELVVLDNGSTNARTRAICEELAATANATVLFEPENLGCAAGRRRAIAAARGDYVVTLDNDVEVQAGWLEALLLRVEDDPAIGAACCRVIRPDGVVEFTGGTLVRDGTFAHFDLLHRGEPADGLATLEETDCAWVPGGATIFPRGVLERVPHCAEYRGPFEDNDHSLQLARAGFRLVSCPLATVVHHHRDAMDEAERRRERAYLEDRDDAARIAQSLLLFYRRHGLIIHDRGAFEMVGIHRLDDAALRRWFEEGAAVPEAAVGSA